MIRCENVKIWRFITPPSSSSSHPNDFFPAFNSLNTSHANQNRIASSSRYPAPESVPRRGRRRGQPTRVPRGPAIAPPSLPRDRTPSQRNKTNISSCITAGDSGEELLQITCLVRTPIVCFSF